LNDRIVLGIESAIGGGSLCITNNGREIDSWVGDGNVSRAEDILPNIDRLNRANSLDLRSFDRIIVSIGPGSFTGIKVGIATVLGLRASLGTTCVGISALEALSLITVDENAVIAVPMGRGGICVQSFRKGISNSEPRLIDHRELIRIGSETIGKLVLHGSLFDEERFPNAVDAGFNVASHLCAAIDSKFISNDLRPLFVDRKSSNI
jgi:tRNA threonylcarbamoyl adenosine modification protein YeaZ